MTDWSNPVNAFVFGVLFFTLGILKSLNFQMTGLRAAYRHAAELCFPVTHE